MIDEYQDFHQAENPRLAYQQYQPHIEAIIQRMCTPTFSNRDTCFTGGILSTHILAVPVEPNQPEMVVAQQKIVPAEAVSSEAPSAPPQAVSAPEKLVFEENTDPEGDQVSKFEWDYNAKIDEKLLEFDYEQSIPNANFIYHNKLPKSGSTTMHDILRYEPTSHPNPETFVKLN